MKKQVLILTVLIILCAAPVMAGEVHDAWHAYDDSFTVDGKVIEVDLRPTSVELLKLSVDEYTVLINFEQCKEYGGFEYCYEEYSYEYDEKATITGSGVLVPGIRLVINDVSESQLASLKLTNSYPSTVNPKETFNFEAIIKNEGDAWANSASYEITIPQGMEITSNGDFSRNGNKLYKTVSIAPGTTRTLKATLKSNNYDDYKFEYVLLVNTDGSISETKNSFTIKSTSPITKTFTVTPTTTNVNRDVTVTLDIKNTDETNTLSNLDVQILGPEKDIIYKSPKNAIVETPGKISNTQSSINAGKTHQLKFTLTPLKVGTYALNGTISGEINGVPVSEDFSSSITVKAEGLSSKVFLSKTELAAGSKFTLQYFIINDNDELKFTNINTKITSDIYSGELFLEQLNKEEEQELIRKEMIAPLIEEDEEFEFTITTTARTETGELIELKDSRKIKVIGTGPILEVSQAIDKTSAKAGEEIIVDVSITNKLDDQIPEVVISDRYTSGAQLIVGDTTTKVFLSGKETKKTYTYKIKLPENYNREYLNITTKAAITGSSYIKEVSKSIPVQITVPAAQEPETQEEPSSAGVQTGNQDSPSEQEPSFWKKLFRNIENFFAGIFS